MQIQQFKKKYHINALLNIAKIVIIAYSGLYLLGNFVPYYQGADSYLYGLEAINLSQGKFEITNELFEETGNSIFLSGNWIRTIHNTAIPIGGIGLPIIGMIFYSIGGYFGLFYLAPIFGIILLIVSERVASKLFGKYVGFLALLFVATNHIVFRNSINLQTESVFSVFFILGVYWFILFFREGKERHLLFVSICFMISTFIRINGAIYLPIEIILVVTFFGLHYYKQRKQSVDQKSNLVGQKYYNLTKKRALRITSAILIPWIVFFVFWFSFYDYYFDDPFTNYRIADESAYEPISHRDSNPKAIVSLQPKNFENMKQYGKYLLPYQFTAVYNKSSQNYDQFFGLHWVGIIPFILIFMILITSIIFKKNRIEAFVFISLILATLWFYSATTTEERASFGVPGRYMVPAFILVYMLYANLIKEMLMVKSPNKKSEKRYLVSGGKILLMTILILFFSGAFYFYPPTEAIKNMEFQFKNPQQFADRYPLDPEGLTENSIIVALHGDWAVDYGVIPFKLKRSEDIPTQDIDLLKDKINSGYDAFVFKEPTYYKEKDVLRNLVENHGIILKDYSKSFCKIELAESNDGLSKSDEICLK